MSDPRSTATPDLVAAWQDFAAELIADFGEFGCDAVTPETKGVGELRMTEILRKHPQREEVAA